MRVAMVWEAATPPMALRLMTELNDLLRGMSSWAMKWPGTSLRRGQGWELMFEVTLDPKGRHVTLLLWPEPGSPEGRA